MCQLRLRPIFALPCMLSLVGCGTEVVPPVKSEVTARPSTPIVTLQLASPDAIARGKTVREIRQLEAPGGVDQVVIAGDRLFIREKQTINIIDAISGKVQETISAKNAFGDMDLSPDGKVLFATDYGGEVIGRGLPAGTHFVHRYRFATGKWEVAEAPKTASGVEALDSNTFVLQSADQWIEVSLNRWNENAARIDEIARAGNLYEGDCIYDPFTGRLLHGSTGTSSPKITLLRIEQDRFVHAGIFEPEDTLTAPLALSSDGKYLYFGGKQADAQILAEPLRRFKTHVLAATADLAVTMADICDAKSGEPVLKFESIIKTAAVNLAGDQICVFNEPKGKLMLYEVAP